MNAPALNPFTGRNVPWLLAERAAMSTHELFLIWHPHSGAPQTVTYGEFASRVDRVASGISELGVKSGDVVIIHLENCLEFLYSWFACSTLGVVSVTTNANSAEGELEYFSRHSRAIAAITQPSLFDRLKRSAAGLRWIACTDHDAGEIPADGSAVGDYVPFGRLMSSTGAAPRLEAGELDIHNIMYTSGTTSRPKGVVYTHANVLWAAKVNSAHFGLTQRDIGYCFLPLYHANALFWQTMATMWVGAALVLQPRFSATRFWDVSGRHGCTWTAHGPFVTLALKKLPYPEQHRFRFWGNAVGRNDEVMEAWGIPSLGWYGMTETVSQPILSDVQFPSDRNAMGRVTVEYEVAVTDESGEPCAVGEIGMLKVRGVRGVSLFPQYLHDPEATKAAFDPDGWFTTGDLVRVLPDGSIAFADREKDMMRVGGENVAASEVEAVIASIEGVIDCAVVGKPHSFLNETPAAFVVPAAEEPSLLAEIQRRCARELAPFKCPKDIFFVESLPRTALGKMDKKALREQLRPSESTGTQQ